MNLYMVVLWLLASRTKDGVHDPLLATRQQANADEDEDYANCRRQSPLLLRFCRDILRRPDILAAGRAAVTVFQPSVCTCSVKDMIAREQSARVTCIEWLKADSTHGPPLVVLASRWACPSPSGNRLVRWWHFESFRTSEMSQKIFLTALLLSPLFCHRVSRFLPMCETPDAVHYRCASEHDEKEQGGESHGRFHKTLGQHKPGCRLPQTFFHHSPQHCCTNSGHDKHSHNR